VDHGWPAVRASAGRIAVFQVGQQGVLLVAGERLPGFDRHPFADASSNARFEFFLQRRFIFLERFDQGAQG